MMFSVPRLWRKIRLQNISFKGRVLFWNVFFLLFVGSSAQEEILCTKPTDLGILLDSSDATVTNWQEVLDFANAFVQFFNVSPTGSKIGVITYSTEANLNMDFNSFQGDNLSSDSVRDVINDLKPTKGRRKIYEALKLANEQLFVRDAGMRDDKDILKVCPG
ncbi:PREDICTED: uncharacterized protein LOC107336354 [Acropora digitifera]|uniref:uncharacterized protein LOC107336354 n=1 Tax=Acropora digitifera TaxID=70779 RepID=UPI00077AAD5E|nr:PREDICTED: uncharacterized protein LOC107336354 [Acropora digitifera]